MTRSESSMPVLQRAQDAFARSAWADAHAAYAEADTQQALDAASLEQLAYSAGLAGNDAALISGLERAHNAWVELGEHTRAAHTAFWCGFRLVSLGDLTRAQAWLARAQRSVERAGPDCVVRGYLQLPAIQQHLLRGAFAEAEAAARSALVVAEQHADGDLDVLASLFLARVLVRRGEVARGLGVFDEAMLSAIEGKLSPVVRGFAYCFVISTCTTVYALDRAREWTTALSTWCEAQPQQLAFAGACLVHRAELMEIGGAWDDAIEEARRAAERLSQRHDPKAMGDACYQQAEIHRLRGDLVEAEAAYASAARSGREPLPGLALLRLAQGRADAAVSAMRRVLASTTDPLQRTRYLPAQVEILLAVGANDELQATSAELVAIAASSEIEVLRALADQARGAVLLATGVPAQAIEPLRAALLLWRRIDAPYLEARLHVLIGRACRALGDEDGAALEWSAAREMFVTLGAAPDLATLAALEAEPVPVTPGEAAQAAATSSARASARRSDRPSDRTPASAAEPASAHGLSPRELEVLRHVATGKTNRAIARLLFLSEKTIDRHVSNLFAKLGVPTRAAATAFAYENRLI